MSAPDRFTVSGPGVDRRAISAEVGLSLATTLASRLGVEGSFYVRDAQGEITGRAERDPLGVVRTYRLSEGGRA
jgi:hypothetical protein